MMGLALELGLKGMLGIFTVLGLLMVSTFGLGYLDKVMPVKEDDD